MRKVKFRGQTQNGDWVFGFLLRKPYTEFSIVDKDGVEHINVRADTIAQFIGLDKHGNELYEGDNVTFTHNGKICRATITLHPHTWTDYSDNLRVEDEEFILSHYALTN